VQFDGVVEYMHTAGMAMSLFMAGMELGFGEIKGRPLRLATSGWCMSVLLGITIVGALHVLPAVGAPWMVYAGAVHDGPRHTDPGVSRQRPAR
jgi:hypothetical protein